VSVSELLRAEHPRFYNPPSGPDNVIRNWAYLGFYPSANQGNADADHLARLNDNSGVTGTFSGVPVDVTTLYPSTGKIYGVGTWAVGSSSTDAVDLLGAGFLNNTGDVFGSTYVACYVKNPGANVWPCYVALGADDFAQVWTGTVSRGTKAVAEGVITDKAMIGPFTLTGSGAWTRLLIKVENGTGAHGLTARLCNDDRTTVTGLTLATTDATAPTAPTATCAGVTSGVSQSTVTAPSFVLADATDPQGTDEGVSGVRGFKYYFGTDPAGAPATFQTSWTIEPGTQTPGTYYLRVAAVDNALNESAATTVFTFVLGAPAPSAHYGLTNRATLDAAVAAASATKAFTVWGWVTVIDANTFSVDDGSGVPVTVVKTAHGLTSADYVSATGTLTVTEGVPSIAATTVKKQN